MPTQRFEGPSLEEAVEAARERIGPAARILGATRVRRGGVAGFFAREHVEVEVDLDEDLRPAAAQARPQAPPKLPPRPKRAGPPAPVATGAAREHSDTVGPGEDPDDEDPMSALITEMAENGPSSILDLAERVNAEQGHYVLAGDAGPPPHRSATAPAPAPRRAAAAPEPVPRRAAAPASAPRRASAATSATSVAAATSAPAPASQRDRVPDRADFAVMLERIAREAGLVPTGPSATPAATEDSSPSAGASHAAAILSELRPSPAPGTDRRPEIPGLERLSEIPGLDRQPEISGLGLALHALGLPLPACQAIRAARARDDLRSELCRALELALPRLPGPPRSPTSVVAVVGPRDQVIAAARAVAAEIGAPSEQVAIATQRKVWRRLEHVISSPEVAAEERRSWRWRDRPSVVAIEQPIRPGGSHWAREILRALEPALCWGVAEASHKPEDLAAWSRALGGLDILALVDLEGTTTPAAALAATIPVGRLDGQPATPQLWASILCARLMGMSE